MEIVEHEKIRRLALNLPWVVFYESVKITEYVLWTKSKNLLQDIIFDSSQI